MKLPEFSEADHPVVQSCLEQSDLELTQGFQSQPDQGRFFVAIFCRYGVLTYSLLRNKARVAMQVDYLFARLWRNVFYELRHLQIAPDSTSEDFSLQSWVVNKIALCINQDEVPAIETIQYSLEAASPPLWCYLQTALEELPPLSRLLLTLSQVFRWQDARIVAVLQAEGEEIDVSEIQPQLQEAYQCLQNSLPKDIRDIYMPEGETDETPTLSET